jgi:hypothetical protein
VGKTKLSAVTVYFPPEDKEKLEAWAQRENRSLSNLVAHLAIKALHPHKSFQDDEESLVNGQVR